MLFGGNKKKNPTEDFDELLRHSKVRFSGWVLSTENAISKFLLHSILSQEVSHTPRRKQKALKMLPSKTSAVSYKH
jgi:hypothetical protein